MDENLIKKFEILFAKNGIKIKDSTKGTFTKYCKGKVTQDCIDKAKRSGNKKLIKKAVFAENARKWKHQNGGILDQASYLIPIYGTYRAVKDAIKDPSLYNIGMAALSAAGDIPVIGLGFKAASVGAKAAKAAKIAKSFAKANIVNANVKRAQAASKAEAAARTYNRAKKMAVPVKMIPQNEVYLRALGQRVGAADKSAKAATNYARQLMRQQSLSPVKESMKAIKSLNFSPLMINALEPAAISVNGLLKHQNGGRLMQMYTALLKRNIDPQLAFETARLAKIEDGRPGHYYVFGKRSDNVEKWADQAVDSLTTGRYTNLRNIKTHEQFKQGLKNKKYNPFPIFYKKMDVGRERDKRIVNQYNKQHNIKLITMADNIDNHYMDNMYIPEKNTVVPTIEVPAENKHFTIPVNYAKEGQKLKKK